ncbi:alpha/beta hydrolase family protein [Cohnella zeiphila]|uniref:Alpha/beta hydrolase n=1 Tax=Cohnella zeiphila TaxID=2761120 RepID=A0A7X0VX19_9BACL|nr:alpha/beta hydrolase [Cohnella zeiphila]MBB6733105.1 alpha/beta hydrolase [Cohnella zeiphila]
MNNETIAIDYAQPSVKRRPWPRWELKRPYRLDRGLWRAVFGGVSVAGAAGAAVGVLGAPTGLGAGVDIAAAVLLYAAGLALAGWAVAWLHRLVGWPLPPLTIAGTLYSAAILISILDYADLGLLFSVVAAVLYLLAGAVAGWLTGIAASRRFGPREKTAALLVLALGIGVPVAADVWPSGGSAALPASFDADDSYAAIEAVEPLSAADPSAEGSYAVRSFTYGSGKDRHRSEFGADATLVSSSVDASAYIRNWSTLRTLFWGFDQKNLPLNGRVWMPEGDGPFPVVLMVHGNHLMEDFSDAGYAYLGELLASRGYIAISVDENFLNYSVWSGIPKEDMKPRAWMLLQHIGQLERFAADPSTPFYGKIDFRSVALLGHSRGGQAVAMAADADEWFAGDRSLPDSSGYQVRAVAALAPTDTMVDGKFARLHDVSYLVLQGAADGDISSFYGERQYGRADFSSAASGFKAALRIGGANHGQFNTSWGAKDDSLPASLFLRDPELSGDDQRQIAKAYVSAFLDTALGRGGDYTALFRDARAGASFLPDTEYVSRYENGSFQALARYEDGGGRQQIVSAASRTDGSITAAVEDAHDRNGDETANHGVVLRWSPDGGSYSLVADGTFAMPDSSEAGDAANATGTDDAVGADSAGLAVSTSKTASAPASFVVFSMSDLAWDGQPGKGKTPPLPQLTVTLKDDGGETASVPLSRVMSVQPSPRTTFTWLGWLENTMADGKYSHSVESALQTYEIPLSEFLQANPSLDPNRLKEIGFAFSGHQGQAMLDDIGLMN